MPDTARSGRWRPVLWWALVFLIVETLVRVILRVETGANIPLGVEDLRVFALGFVFDLATLAYVALPLVLLTAAVPTHGRLARPGRFAIEALCAILLAGLLFVAVSEWTFWQEFQTRFNFIAVDYLVYTTEVIGNIRQSYPVTPILIGILVATALILWATRRFRRMPDVRGDALARIAVPIAWIVAAVVATAFLTGDLKDRGRNAYADELAGNGIYEFFAAYRAASLDYDRFYRTIPDADADAEVRRALATPDATFLHPTGIDRLIHNAAPERRLNVVLISVESFSAEFSGTYGRAESLTPELDRLTPQSLVFDRLYASGTRTVRGLEALSLSVPPTPGESIVKRPHNEGLFSLASVFNAHGYASEFLYGGYGAFDNMNYYFGHNGYAVHDRTEIPDNAIHSENVWGVADEDLYTMAMRRFDADYAAHRPFFAHVMTTSNHRPYTVPEGRGPWKQHKRVSAVRYTDWAIGDFIRRARTHPWFANTVFVITADHCAMSAGKAALPAFRYHIPLWIYAPGQIAPGHVDGLVSQIDVPPTLLGLLGFDYPSRFYGVDVFQSKPDRAFIGTYQLLGFLQRDRLVQLAPHRAVSTLVPAMDADQPQPPAADDPKRTLRAVAFYEHAAHRFTSGAMRVPLSAATPGRH
ncbi:LTA synthase family protein [Cognatilysobacter terrigena]|uniref:LTA synthase family protein n=1 Tax=Cognatilysobacter terrigena TaxID=2488749 RepID=UPI00105FFFC5|nr:LTA synthase family protein [Lysobacter terrigena]